MTPVCITQMADAERDKEISKKLADVNRRSSGGSGR